MRAWVLSICGVVFLGLMVDVLSPEGKINKFIKGVFAIILLYVIVNPIVDILGRKFSINTNVTWQTNDELISTINEQKLTELKLQIDGVLQQNGYDLCVEIDGIFANNVLCVNKIKVKHLDQVLTDVDKHIYDTKVVSQLICDVAKVSEEVVVFEWKTRCRIFTRKLHAN